MRVFIILLGLFSCALQCAVFAQDLVVDQHLSASALRDGNLLRFSFTSPNSNIEPQMTQVTAELWFDGVLVASQRGQAEVVMSTTGYQFTPDEVNYHSALFGRESFFQMLLPEGSYRLCVELNESGRIYKDCKSFFHRALENPICLRQISPADQSVLVSNHPLFTWTSCINTSLGYTYGLRVVENTVNQRDGFSAYNYGVPIYENLSIPEPVLLYPVVSVPLEEGKSYLWQVEIRSGKYIVARSSFWDFKLKSNKLYDELPISRGYIDITEVHAGSFYYFLGNMSLKYKPMKSSSTILVSITDEKGELVSKEKFSLDFDRMNPYAILDLTQISGVKHLGTYKAKLTEGDRDVVDFQFLFINPYLSSELPD